MKKILFGIILLTTVTMIIVHAETNPKIEFMGNDYFLKWSNITDTGYINEYLTNGETLDNYHTMITIIQNLTSNNKDDFTQTLYDSMTGKGVAKTSKINDKANYIQFCALAQVPVKHVECSYYNIQNGVGNVMVFVFTKRYYPSEIESHEVMTNMLIDDEKIYKPYIDKIIMPQIVRKKISAPSSYMYLMQ